MSAAVPPKRTTAPNVAARTGAREQTSTNTATVNRVFRFVQNPKIGFIIFLPLRRARDAGALATHDPGLRSVLTVIRRFCGAATRSRLRKPAQKSRMRGESLSHPFFVLLSTQTPTDTSTC